MPTYTVHTHSFTLIPAGHDRSELKGVAHTVPHANHSHPNDNLGCCMYKLNWVPLQRLDICFGEEHFNKSQYIHDSSCSAPFCTSWRVETPDLLVPVMLGEAKPKPGNAANRAISVVKSL